MECRHCRWWRDGYSSWDNSGECRRYPPIATERHSRGGDRAAFPRVTASDWCGEFRVRDRNKDQHDQS